MIGTQNRLVWPMVSSDSWRDMCTPGSTRAKTSGSNGVLTATVRALAVALIASALMSGPLAAQDRALVIAARGGVATPISTLDGSSATKVQGGLDIGGGVAVELNDRFGARADVVWTQGELREHGSVFGTTLDRIFLDAAVQTNYESPAGWRLGAFVGGGIVRLSGDPDVGTTTRPAMTFGGGLTHPIATTPLDFFLETKAWIYGLEGLEGEFTPYKRTQFEVGAQAGVALRLPF